MTRPIKSDDLIIHFLNVGFGDNIVIQFPEDDNGNRKYGLVDCKNGTKTLDYLGKLMNGQPTRLAFVCATHPHYDHISGISKVINSQYYPHEFWDSGFRHNSQTYSHILEDIIDRNIRMVRVSSGMEWYFHQVRITALSPSIMLRNRYATYGVDMNNASIVLRIEHNQENVITMESKKYTAADDSDEIVRQTGRSVVILTGDAEFDSWSHICQEFPMVERTSTHDPLVKKMVNYLSSAVVKVAHHGSMHSTPLDVYEKMSPNTAIISTKQKQSSKHLDNSTINELDRELFPHRLAVMALEESDSWVLTTDGSYEGQPLADGSKKDNHNAHPGTIIVVVPPAGDAICKKLNDSPGAMATPPSDI